MFNHESSFRDLGIWFKHINLSNKASMSQQLLTISIRLNTHNPNQLLKSDLLYFILPSYFLSHWQLETISSFHSFWTVARKNKLPKTNSKNFLQLYSWTEWKRVEQEYHIETQIKLSSSSIYVLQITGYGCSQMKINKTKIPLTNEGIAQAVSGLKITDYLSPGI